MPPTNARPRILAQVLAMESNIENSSHKEFTDVHRLIDGSKNTLVNGINRTYEPVDNDGEQLPDEPGFIAVVVNEQIALVRKTLARWYDMAATREWGNASATADLVIPGGDTIPNVPVMYLVFLDKHLRDLHTFVSKLPVVDLPTEQWTLDSKDGLQKTSPITTTRTAKVPEVITLYPHTDKHPAQTQLAFNDKIIGHFKTVKMSSALTPARRAVLVERVQALQAAVKNARELANTTQVEEKHVAGIVLDYVFS